MFNKIDKVFARVRKQNRIAIMPYLIMGYPTPEVSLPLLKTLANSGADIIEVGIPHSDPIADGPVIQYASNVALQYDITVDLVMAKLGELRISNPDTAVIIMSYYNIILQYGLDDFIDKCVENDVSGLIIPDLSSKESQSLQERLLNAKIHMIYMIPPNLSDEHIQKIVKLASGFIYMVAVTGITGIRDSIPEQVVKNARKLRQLTDVPLALGFGISSKAHVGTAAQSMDGVIIGSALIKEIADPNTAIAKAEQFMTQVANYE